MSRLRSRFPQLRYFILGQGEEKCELEKLVKELGLNDVVLFAGTTSELENAYNMADILVMLTDDEGNSIACHEAMSSGLPVLVSDTGGFIESVPPNAGFRVNPGNTQWICLLYTSDAADERSSVDLGGRRIIKKKKT